MRSQAIRQAGIAQTDVEQMGVARTGIAKSLPARTLAAWLLAGALCGALFAGTAEAGRTDGAKLSEGVTEAKKTDKDKKKVLVAGKSKKRDTKRTGAVVSVHHHEERCCPDGHHHVHGVVLEGERFGQSEYLGVQFGGTHFTRGAIRSSRSLSVRFGRTQLALDGRLAGEVDVTAASVRFDSQTARGLRDGQDLTVGATARLDLIRDVPLPGVQLIGGLRGGWLLWDYRSPIWIEDERGDLVEAAHDDVITYTPYAGLGLSLVSSRHFHLGADVIFGVTFFDDHTDQGLANDLFEVTRRTELKVGASFLW